MKKNILRNVTISLVGIMSLLPLFGFTSLQNAKCISSLKIKHIGLNSGDGSEMDDVVKRFEREVTLHHSQYVNEYVADWKAFQQWDSEKDAQGDRVLWINPNDMTENTAHTITITAFNNATSATKTMVYEARFLWEKY